MYNSRLPFCCPVEVLGAGVLSRRELETEIAGLSTLTVRIRKGQAIMNNFIGNEQRISGTKALKRDGPSGPTLFKTQSISK